MSRESLPAIPASEARAATVLETPSAPPTPLVTAWELALPELAATLTHTLDRISPTRTGIVTDQIRTILKSNTTERLICIAASHGVPELERAVIAIAVHTDASDSATMLHLDWVNPKAMLDQTQQSRQQLASAIWQKLHAVFVTSGVSFVQWATDPVAATQSLESTSVAAWPTTLRFEHIGTLDYLALDCDDNGDWGPFPPANSSGAMNGQPDLRLHLHLIPFAPHDAQATRDFEQLVQRTYVDSLDCPPLEKFRSASEIIGGYRAVAAYSPDLWFTVEVPSGASGAPTAIGSLILAKHPGPAMQDAETVNPAAVLELVYMGIVPAHRGRGYGQRMMWMIAELCQQHGAERLILAVDQNNEPAIAAYHHFGMQPLFRETVWGRAATQ